MRVTPFDALDGDPEDPIPAVLRSARPAPGNVAAALTRARVARQLFGEAATVRIGRYEIEAKAGAGGGGEVFVARDPELSRRVAIKLMRAGGDRERMLAEGHALARLSHPHIVPVYDAGALGEQVYVVMELVEGDTLRAYCAAPERRVRDIVRAYRQAAEGLDAAHRAGVIHPDFKPDNALVGRDGRVRVVDFGLARSGLDDAATEAAIEALEAASPVAVTHAGLGTPGYMAPEQATAATLTPAADQYAFCASLREGLAARGPLPRWLEAIVRRGMTQAPGDRYPSMAAVHAALGRDPASRWRVRAVLAGVLGLAAAAFLVGRGDRVVGPTCDGGGAQLARIWNIATPAQLAGRVAALGTPYARQAAPYVAATLAGYAERWRAGDREACVAHRDGAQSSAVFDRRVACLARARAALATAVRVVGDARAGELADAIAAIGELPDLERCADPSVLTTSAPPPGVASAVAGLADELAALEVEVRAARPGVRPRIAALIARARGLGYPLVLARALRLAGRAALAVHAWSDAVPPFAEATTLALTAGDAALAVEGFTGRMYAARTDQRDAALAGVELVEAIAAGLPVSERAIHARFYSSRGSVALAAGQRDQARTLFEQALALAREVTGPATLDVAVIWTNLALAIEDPVRRAALARERIALVEARLDPAHPVGLAARITAAQLETDPRRAAAGLAPSCTQLGALHPEHGAEIIQCQYQLGWLAIERGDLAQARQAFERAVARARPGAEPDLETPELRLARAYVELLAGRLDGAARRLAEATAALGPLDGAAWWRLGDAADVLLARGELASRTGRLRDARASFAAARQHLENVLVTSSVPRFTRRLAYARARLVRSWPAGQVPAEARRDGEAAIAWYRSAGGYADAIAALERALDP